MSADICLFFNSDERRIAENSLRLPLIIQLRKHNIISIDKHIHEYTGLQQYISAVASTKVVKERHMAVSTFGVFQYFSSNAANSYIYDC